MYISCNKQSIVSNILQKQSFFYTAQRTQLAIQVYRTLQSFSSFVSANYAVLCGTLLEASEDVRLMMSISLL